MLDRAEKLFSRLSQGSRYQVQALEALCGIYEQEREWEKAIEAGKRLEVLGGRSLALQIAHYYCELAEAAAAAGDYASARQYVKNAQAGRPRTMRGALTRAHIARDTDDSKTALKLYHRIIDENTYLIAEALPEIVAIYTRENEVDELERALKSMLAKNPEMSSLVAYTAIVNDIGGIPVIDECVEQYMLNEPTLGEFVELQHLSDEKGEADSSICESPWRAVQTCGRNAAIPVSGMRFFESAAAVAMPELPGLGNTTASIARSVRYGAAAQHYQINRPVSLPDAARRRRLSSLVSYQRRS